MAGIVTGGNQAEEVAQGLIAAMGQHRYWGRAVAEAVSA